MRHVSAEVLVSQNSFPKGMQGSCRASTLHCLLSNTKLHAFGGGTAALLSVTRSHSCNHFTEAMVYIIWLIFKIYWHQSPSSLFSPSFLSFPFSPFPAKPEICRWFTAWLGSLPCLSTAWSGVVFAVLSAVFILRAARQMAWPGTNGMAFCLWVWDQMGWPIICSVYPQMSVSEVSEAWKIFKWKSQEIEQSCQSRRYAAFAQLYIVFGESCQNQFPFQPTKVNFWNIGAKMF